MRQVAFPWLPVGTTLGRGVTSGRVLRAGDGWQVLATSEPSLAALLLNPRNEGSPSWWPEEVAAARAELTLGEIGDGA